ncbi:MAG TPA: protein kinase [Blastocatellia bacterium]|nr:protein kinase [Blastocatellia bacterium]
MTKIINEEPSNGLPFRYIGNYRLVEMLGAGGMGEVYLAIEEPVGRKVAIKLMLAGLDVGYLQRFNDERKALASLNQRNIVTMFASGQVDNRHYFVMEHLEGESLRARMSREPIPQPEIAEITRQICDALNAAHNRGIVHRDIKPENIFLSRDDDGRLVKILDFGIATLKESDTRTTARAVIGTGPYLSPEQARGASRQEIDGRADIYSLGLVVYEMLTGVTAFTASDPIGYLHLHVKTLPPCPSERAPAAGIGAAVDQVVMKALAKDPSERFPTARDFARSLKEAVERPSAPLPHRQNFPTQTEVIDELPTVSARHRVPSPVPSAVPPAVPPVVPSAPGFLSRYALPLGILVVLVLGGGWLTRGYFNTPSDVNGADGVTGTPPKPPETAATPGSTPAIVAPRPELNVEFVQEGRGPVPAETVFHSGDAMRLVASSNRDGNLYIVLKGTTGPIRILYPDPRIKGSYNQARAGQRIEIPSSTDEMPWFRLDNRPGAETFYIVFATQSGDERIRTLEAAIQQRRRQFNAAEERQTMEALEALITGPSSDSTVTARKLLLRHER